MKFLTFWPIHSLTDSIMNYKHIFCSLITFYFIIVIDATQSCKQICQQFWSDHHKNPYISIPRSKYRSIIEENCCVWTERENNYFGKTRWCDEMKKEYRCYCLGHDEFCGEDKKNYKK